MSQEPKPSATVVLLRDFETSLQLLLLQRSPRNGKDGPWVFPGGKVDPGDAVGSGEDAQQNALQAARRETREEAGIDINPADLTTISRWITPEISPRRFDTWFFLGQVRGDEEILVDGDEICAHRWLSPEGALSGHESGELSLAPPTFVTVTWLAGYRNASSAFAELHEEPVITFRPRICMRPGGAIMLYPGDAGYEAEEPETPGPRHRLWAMPNYRYERS